MELNSLIKYLFITLAIALISSTSSAITVKGSLYTNPKGTYTYESTLDHKEEIVYEQTGANVPLVQDINNKQDLNKMNSVAGVNLGGYSKLIITKVDEKNVMIESDRQEYITNTEVAKLNYKAAGTISKGTWSDLLANKPVVITLSAASKENLRTRLKSYLSVVIRTMANQKLKAEGGFKAAVVGSFKSIMIADEQTSIESVFEGNKDTMNQRFNMRAGFMLSNK